MTPVEVAAELEAFASQVIGLPGVSRRNPHAFAEAKDELARLMRRRALELRTALRTVPARPVPKPAILPGTRTVGRREIRVEVRRGSRLSA